MGELNFFNLNGKKISKESLTSKNIDLSKLNDNLKSKLSIFDSDKSGVLDTPDELNSFWESLSKASKANQNGNPEDLDMDEIKEFLGNEGLEEAEAKDFAEFVLGFVKQETEVIETGFETELAVDEVEADLKEMIEGEEITRTAEDGTISTFKRVGDKIIETKSDEKGTLECVYDTTVLDDVSQTNMSSSKFVSIDGTEYEVKYGKKGDAEFTVTFLANNDSPWELAKKIETIKNEGKKPSNAAIRKTWCDIQDLNGKNKNYKVTTSVKLPGFYLANDPLITGQGTKEQAKKDYEKATAKYYEEANARQNNVKTFKNNDISTYEELAKYLFNLEGIEVENHLQIDLRVQQLKALNNIEDGKLAGKELKVAVAPNFDVSGLSYSDSLKGPLSFESLEKYLKHCEARGVDCADIKELMDTVKNKNFTGELRNKYLQYFQKKLKARLASIGKTPETLPKEKFNGANFRQNPDSNDCWFLSTIGKLSEDDVNRKKLQDMVTYNPEKDTVSVKLPSFSEPYEIPLSRLQGATEFSSGDLWVRALEMAAEKFLIERNNSIDLIKVGAGNDRVQSPFDGGTMRYATAILFETKVTPTDYLDTSMVRQMYASLAEKTGTATIVSEVFDSIGLDKTYQDKDAYNYYHSISTISKALSEHKLVAAITTDLMNKDGQTGNHVCFVSKVENGFIYVRDPEGGTTKYTEEEFKKKFPLVEIIAAENEPEVPFNRSVASAINNVPMHYATTDPSKLINEIFNLIDDRSVNDAIATYKRIINNPTSRKEIQKVLTDLTKNLNFGTDYDPEIRKIIVALSTNPDVVEHLSIDHYNIIKKVINKKPISVEKDVITLTNIALAFSVLKDEDVQRFIYHQSSDAIYNWAHENGLGGVNDFLYENCTKPAVTLYKCLRDQF